ncbi:MAG: NTP transferase domain-containing protein [bacterium]
MRTLDAIVLAGDSEAAVPVLGDNKAFLLYKEKPLVTWVVEALERSETVSSITVIGPGSRLEKSLTGYSSAKPLHVREQGRDIFENIYYGALSTFPAYREGATEEELKSSPESDKAVFALTSDLPLIEPFEIDHFISTAPLDSANIVYGFTREDLLEPFTPHGVAPGEWWMYYCFKEYIARHSNIFCFRPLHLGAVTGKYVPIIYNLRYQRHFRNVVSGLFAISRYVLTPGNLFYYFLLQIAKTSHRRGWHRLRDMIRPYVPVAVVEKRISRLFQTSGRILETIGPGPTLDVDDELSYREIQERGHEWKKLQLELLEKERAAAG